jgi:hypothetical protein
VAEHLPSKYKALSSNPSTAKNKGMEKERAVPVSSRITICGHSLAWEVRTQPLLGKQFGLV